MAEQLAAADRYSCADERDEGKTPRESGGGKGEEEDGALNLVNTSLYDVPVLVSFKSSIQSNKILLCVM